MKTYYFILILLVFIIPLSYSQPWKMPISLATSIDGTNFSNSILFQDSSGVPCVIRWKADTLICAFQWFRQPVGSVSWDRVAVKYSYDNGKSWTEPSPIIMMDMPGSYQRPFDPTLVVFAKDSIRIYFSSSDGMPMGGSDSIINTYSAKSSDGLHYYFEANPRVDVANKPVIDPAVAYFKQSWHYTAPAGAPQDGARHYISQDGIHFNVAPIIPSDIMHNWTGNLMVNNGNELRFYGSGPMVWYKSSINGSSWGGFSDTNIKGGDPSVIQLDDGTYIMIYVGKPNVVAISNELNLDNIPIIYPNPATTMISLKTNQVIENAFRIYTTDGVLVKQGLMQNGNEIGIEDLLIGNYLLGFNTDKGNHIILKFEKILGL